MQAKHLRLAVSVAIAGLVGCTAPYATTGAFVPSENKLASRRGASASYEVLYSFDPSRGGAFPYGGLAVLNGLLYGVTNGGNYSKGTVFRITPKGKLETIYTFKGGADGLLPQGPLLVYKGDLYGTTFLGGAGSCANGLGCGTIFKVSPGGAEKVLYRFPGYGGGGLLNGGLVMVQSKLYGTTYSGGGSKGWGTVFSVTTSGKEELLYEFVGGSDGEIPSNAPLLAVGNVLYGTTLYGGISGTTCSPYGGCGTAYKISTSGKEAVLHAFTGDTSCQANTKDGAEPAGGLLALNGLVYGTTAYGGTCYNQSFSVGTVFAMTTAGEEHAFHYFNFTNGALPANTLIYAYGKFYGTTAEGGPASCISQGSCQGVIFAISPTGKENVLHYLKGAQYGDGSGASGALTLLNGKLYGVTAYGGKYTSGFARGYGTVFEVAP